ncbi:MAG: hypothetical protein U9N09_06165 [Euryarchaeota archaeon]|nr:hypothetical protein [Euryarchaeota archaeon]
MMFRHQMTGSWQDSNDCRLPRMSRVSVALLALACTLLMCGVAGAVDYGEINVTSANDGEWSTDLSSNVSNVAGDIIKNATVKGDAL